MSIRVIARAVAKPDARDMLREALLANAGPSRREPGCLRYEVAQSASDPNELLTIEEWRSPADVEAHMKTAHVAALLTKVPALLAQPPDIRSYTIVG